MTASTSVGDGIAWSSLEHAASDAGETWPDASSLATLAKRIAYVWAPALGVTRARDAAAATVTPIAMDPETAPPLVILALGALSHRSRAGWNLDARSEDRLALLAARVWRAWCVETGWSHETLALAGAL